MTSEHTFTLAEIARLLEAPQHRLIHLCEKGVVIPDIHDAAGRGSSRVFSARNFLEFAVALRLRDMMLPVGIVGALLYVLRAFEDQLRKDLGGLSLVESLRAASSPDLRILISDGLTVYFSLAGAGQEPKLFGGIPLDQLRRDRASWKVSLTLLKPRKSRANGDGCLGGPERSHFARLELSVTAVAQALPLD